MDSHLLARNQSTLEPVTDGFIYQRILDDGRLLAIVPLTFGRARITIGPANTGCYDDGW